MACPFPLSLIRQSRCSLRYLQQFRRLDSVAVPQLSVAPILIPFDVLISEWPETLFPLHHLTPDNSIETAYENRERTLKTESRLTTVRESMLCLREGGSWSQLLRTLLDSVTGETALAVSVSSASSGHRTSTLRGQWTAMICFDQTAPGLFCIIQARCVEEP
jgi:hypothetical protein